MKLRTSFCNGAVLDKNITRFAPLWVGYSIFLVVHLLTKGSMRINSELQYLLQGKFLRIGTLFYGMICGVTLFGDLFSHRRTQGLHGLPMRRECFFLTNALTGLLFFFIPILLFFVATGMRSDEQNYYLIPEFLLAYGVSLLCVQLSGSRIVAILLLVVAVCLPAVCKWLFVNLYHSLLSSIGVEEISNSTVFQSVLGGLETSRETGWIRVVAGIAAMAVALLLYRFRKLENTGYFGILRGLRGVFAAVFAFVLSGMIGAKISSTIQGIYFVLALLIPAFFIIGTMLAERSIKIWKPGYILTLALFMIAIFGTLWYTRYDIDKQKAYVPEPDTVQSVKVMINDYGKNNGYRYFEYTAAVLTAPEDIESITRIHRQLLPYRSTYEDGQMVYLTYTMDDGNQILRYYPIALTESFEALEKTLSTQTAVFGTKDFGSYVNRVNLVTVYSRSYYKETTGSIAFGSAEEINNITEVFRCENRELLEQFLWLLQDACEAGELSQVADYSYSVRIHSVDEMGEEEIHKLTVPVGTSGVESFLQELVSELPYYTIR